MGTTGLETSFQAVGNTMNQLAQQQQQIANAQVNQSLIQQQQERGHMVALMDTRLLVLPYRAHMTVFSHRYQCMMDQIPRNSGLGSII